MIVRQDKTLQQLDGIEGGPSVRQTTMDAFTISYADGVKAAEVVSKRLQKSLTAMTAQRENGAGVGAGAPGRGSSRGASTVAARRGDRGRGGGSRGRRNVPTSSTV
jgi:hypothetical protein